MIELLNIDCMEYMKNVPDKHFDLAIVDPPYGINKDGQKKSTGGNGGRKAHDFKGWDDAPPDKNYFDELFRISNNQIIWGANYMTTFLPPSMGWIFWDKGQDLNQSDGEFAFTSFQIAARRKVINRVELLKEGTIHPTQKPIRLYRWLLKNYANEGDKIFDSHGGSFNSAIAIHEMNIKHKMNLSFVGCELNGDYYREATDRYKLFTSQTAISF